MERDTARDKSSVHSDSGGAQPGYVLLSTKLNVPSVRTNLVTRQRLIGQLHEGARGKLTLVCAPAGFGKSTLLADWISRRGPAVGWVSLDREDNDPARFLWYLTAALQTAAADIGENSRPLLQPPRPPSPKLLTQLLNEVAAVPEDLTLVLDDYHLIEDDAVHATLAFLLEHLPPQMHLVIASRTEPALALSRLLAGGDLTKLSATDLRFTSEEAADFLRDVMRLELSAGDVAALEVRTEGWIAALQLAALSMRGREDVSGFVSAFAGTDRHVFDYLAEEVLDRQTEQTRTFLLRTSILDRLSGPLCDAVTGQKRSQTTLEKLERMNLLLVPLDDRRRWYRYHHLFSGFLRERLRRSLPETVSGLHRRASEWHEENGTEKEAIGHALAAEDFERAADLIEQLADSLMGGGDFPTVERLMMALPDEIIRARPRLYMDYVTMVVMTGRNGWNDAETALRDIEQMLGLSDAGTTGSSSPRSAGSIGGEELRRNASYLATARANIAYEGHGDLPRAISLNRRAVDLLTGEEDEASPCIPASNLAECLLDSGDLPAAKAAIDEAMEISRAAGYPSETMWNLIHRGRLMTIEGHLSEAKKVYERVLRFTAEHEEAGLLLDAGVAHVRMGELLFEHNDLEAATRHLLLGIERTLDWVGLGEATSRLLQATETRDRLEYVDADAAHGVVPGHIALARMRHAQGDTKRAHEALRKVEWLAQNARVSPLWKGRTERWGAAWYARLCIGEGNLRAADRWAQDRQLRSTDDPDYCSELEYTTLARLRLAQGKHGEAAHLLGQLMEAAEAGGRGRTVIELLVLQSLTLRAQSDEPGALAALERALLLAEPEGYIRTFVDEGEPMAELLRRLLKAWRRERPGDVPLEYVGKLLEALGATVTAPARAKLRDTADIVVDPITGRELEVLRLLDSDLSNREIAARLFVSIDTVKSHTRHLYAKLGVNNRHRAVSRARELDLL